jgi:S-disulfanyl-L-cysteine oxidoreductase SoxD
MKRALVCAAFGLTVSAVVAQDNFRGVGRPATAAEVSAWDIDVRADFKGLPAGLGSVAKGQGVWDAKCASCHGVFAESNEVFPPIVGGTAPGDMQAGRVGGLTSGAESSRTTLMKLAQLSSLWDYINRAMPWNAPKSLTSDEVYAVTAYILNLGDIVPADFVLSDKNIAATQAKLPNRNGLMRDHGLWSLRGKPDVNAPACMSNCNPQVRVESQLPEYARNAHGNLADQMRQLGGVRGAVTGSTVAANAVPVAASGADELIKRYACFTCHATNTRLLGPSFTEVSKKYAADANAAKYLAAKVQAGGQGVWGSIAMPAQTAVSAADAAVLAQWILAIK